MRQPKKRARGRKVEKLEALIAIPISTVDHIAISVVAPVVCQYNIPIVAPANNIQRKSGSKKVSR